MLHSNSVRVPSLQVGKSYEMKIWDKKNTTQLVTFVGYTHAGVAAAKLLPINKMTDVDVLHFDKDGYRFVGVQKRQCLVLGHTDKRITFFSVEGASDTLQGSVGVVVGTEQLTVEEDKLSRKRRIDAERKRIARALAKQQA